MKVALVIDKFSMGGGIINLFRLVKNMPSIKFGVFGKKGRYVNLFKDLNNVQIFNGGYSPNYIASFKPDLVHFNHLKPLFKWSFQNKIENVPIIFTAHGLHVHKYEFQNSFDSKLKNFLRRRLEQFLFNRCTYIVTVSESDRIWLSRNYNIKNTVYIPNGIESKDICLEKTKEIKSSDNFEDINKKNFIFLTIARFDFPKGHDILIRAIGLIKNRLPKNMYFFLIGNGPLFSKMKSNVNNEGIEDFVVFLNEKIDNDYFWQKANVFILPSRWEGLPTVILEAGLYKKLVIASNTYGNNELIRDKKTGILFKTEDAKDLARKILQSYTNYRFIRISGRNLYNLITEKYTIKKMVKKYKEIYIICYKRKKVQYDKNFYIKNE